jgi:hypothetical protein
MKVRPELLEYQLIQAALPVIGVDESGRIDYSRSLTPKEQTDAAAVVAAHDPNAQAPWEIDDQQAKQSKDAFRSLPDWSTWTPQQASDYISQTVLTGQTKAQVNSWIDTNVTSLATAVTALKLLAGAIVDLRTILAVVASAVLMLRNVVIRRM